MVKTREPSEHELTGDGELLRLKLLPIDDSQQVALAYEPVAEEAAVEPAPAVSVPESARWPIRAPRPAPEVRVAAAPQQPAAPQQGTLQTYGTADACRSARRRPGWPPASCWSVQVLSADATGTQIQVVGDGELGLFDLPACRTPNVS